MGNLIRNADFEADWGEESSHACRVFPLPGEPEDRELGNVFTPPGWLTWFRHGGPIPLPHDPSNRNGWCQPEVRDVWKSQYPRRVHSGVKGLLLFTFFRVHDAGFMQRVAVPKGSRLRLSAFAHAWSSKDNDPATSEGVPGPFFALSSQPASSDERNFTFWVGIHPRGELDPYSSEVVWGPGAHIYNAYHEVPPVEAVAQADTVTVILRSMCLWPFQHNDAYWDSVVMEVVGEEPQRGAPREQYERVYVLLPPNAGREWAEAAIHATWDDHRYTVGGSGDDAGIGDLDSRTVIAVNPGAWPGPMTLEEFFQTYYPGVELLTVKAQTPEELAQALR